MKNKIIYILIIAIFFSGCAYVLKPKDFNYRYSYKNTDLDTLININGYYLANRDGHKTGLIFYKNGLVAYPSNHIYHDSLEFEEYVVDKETSKAKKFDSRWAGWGLYKVYGDTIKIQSTNWYDRVTQMETTYSIFLIKNKTEIILISNSRKIKDIKGTFKFTPYNNRIDSSNWLLKKKWFWTKDAWKNRKNK